MKRKQIKLTGTLLTAVLMMGSAQATLLVREDFNTDPTTPDYANGVYWSGKDLVDAGGNATCTGGTIVGFDGTTAWDIPSGQSSGSYFDAYANLLRMLHRTYGPTYVGRQITASVAGKTAAYAKATMRIREGDGSGASDSYGFAWIGFSANNSLGSAGGAAIGYNWDDANSEWDLALRYNNGSVSVATIADGVAYDNIQEIYWAMDDATDTIKVWVDNNDYSTAADLTVTDWQGTVSAITHLSAGFAETGSSDVWAYDTQLGDTGEDVGMIPEPGTLSLLGVATFGALLIRRIKM